MRWSLPASRTAELLRTSAELCRDATLVLACSRSRLESSRALLVRIRSLPVALEPPEPEGSP